MPPPVFRNLGMPPAKMPPSCGPPPIESAAEPVAGGASLLLLPRFAAGTPRLGIGGAPPTGGPDGPFTPPPTIGDDRSFVCVLFNFRPFVMSPNNAPCVIVNILLQNRLWLGLYPALGCSCGRSCRQVSRRRRWWGGSTETSWGRRRWWWRRWWRRHAP